VSEREPTPDTEPGSNRLRNVYLLFVALWRLVRGEDQRGRKVRWMIGLLRPYRGRMTLMFVALLIETGAGLAPPYLAGHAIDAGIATGDLSALNLTVAAFVGAALLYAVGTYAETYLVGWVGTRALQDLRERLFSHIQSMSIGFFTRRSLEVVAERLHRRLSTNDRNLHVIAHERVSPGLLRALRKPTGARLLAPLGRRRSLAHDDADQLQACLQAHQRSVPTD